MSSKIQELEKSHIKGQKEMDERVNQLKMMYTQNPKLAKVKPGVLKKKINLKNL